MFPFVSSFLINPLHNCHLSSPKSDFGEIWPKAGEAKKLNLKFIALLKFKFADYLRMICLPCTCSLFFPRTNYHNFMIKGSFCVLQHPFLHFAQTQVFLAKAGERWVWAAANQRQLWFCKIAPSVSGNLFQCVSFLDCSSSVARMKYWAVW